MDLARGLACLILGTNMTCKLGLEVAALSRCSIPFECHFCPACMGETQEVNLLLG